jgi:hypothetical protein
MWHFPLQTWQSNVRFPSILTLGLSLALVVRCLQCSAMDELSTFCQGLTYLGVALRHSDGPLIVTLPHSAWTRLYYEASRKMQEHSVHIGNGGIVAQYPPPDGESYSTGFWLTGHWIKAKVTP